MGIPLFYKKLKKVCNNSIIEDIKIYNDKKWDYLFFDFQSIIYSAYSLFSSEINYIIILLFYLRYLLYNDKIELFNNKYNNVSYKDVLNYPGQDLFVP